MTIRDLELMKDISPLFRKKIVIWGVQDKGRRLLRELRSMGAGKKGIVLCDSDTTLWGEQTEGLRIHSVKEVGELLRAKDEDGFVVCVAYENVQAQDEVLYQIEQMHVEGVDVCTEYGMEWGLYLGLMNRNVEEDYREKMLPEHDRNRICYEESSMTDQMKYFAYAPLHGNEMILIYQPGKVGSRSLFWSLKEYGRYVLHSHVLRRSEYGDDTLQELLQHNAAKIISIVRDPVSRRISEMWQNIPSVNRYSAEVDFKEIERFYFKEGFERQEFNWFHYELENVLGINVYVHPFSREEGYCVIRENKIEILLMKVERLNSLEGVIGDFLGIPDFRLQNRNIAVQKRYRFAYQKYLEEYTLPRERLKQIYYENPYMDFFYTKQEIDGFYQKWVRD